jgi:hypothetical protein
MNLRLNGAGWTKPVDEYVACGLLSGGPFRDWTDIKEKISSLTIATPANLVVLPGELDLGEDTAAPSTKKATSSLRTLAILMHEGHVGLLRGNHIATARKRGRVCARWPTKDTHSRGMCTRCRVTLLLLYAVRARYR